MKILIPKDTEICIIKPGQKKEDKPTYKYINIKDDFETEATEFGKHYIFKYKCLQRSAVLKKNVLYLL